MIVRRQSTEGRSKGKTDVEEQQQALAVEPVGETGREDAGNSRAERIGRDRHAKLRGRNIQRRHDDGAERRHDHEVEDDRELDKRQQRNQQRLVSRKAAIQHGLLVNRRYQGLFGHDIHSKREDGFAMRPANAPSGKDVIDLA
jgi:hypothetical protein